MNQITRIMRRRQSRRRPDHRPAPYSALTLSEVMKDLDPGWSVSAAAIETQQGEAQ